MSSLDKMNYEPSGVPANQHIYAANVRPVDALFPGARFGRRLAFTISDRCRAAVAIPTRRRCQMKARCQRRRATS